MSDETVKYLLPESEIPTHWINLLPDLPGDPLPPLHPGHAAARRPRRPHADLPDVADPAGGLGRARRSRSPSPSATPTSCGARRRSSAPAGWERALDTPAHIYYKYEGVSPAGSHKPNTAVAQAYENAQAGIKRLSTETGAGQWGSALAFACSLFGLECEVFMVGSSYDQKPYRRSMMETWGATCHRSPSDLTQAGKANASHPTGSLGIAISEAVEVAAQRDDTNYSLGSVLNHVCLHQTVIGQEAIAQMAMAGEQPDVVVGCVGGGSNFAGPDVPVHPRGPARQREDAVPRDRADGLPDAHPRRLPLRLRRHRRADAADADVHARPRLRAAAGARRRPALPRRRPDALRAGQGRRRRGPGLQPERHLRRGDPSSPATRGSSPAPSPPTRSRA